jgi:hypothetical protein
MAKTREVAVTPRNDAYTGLLAISFLALVGASVLMYMDADSLGKPPGKLNINVPGATAGKAGEGLTRPNLGGGAAPEGKDGKAGPGGGAGAKAEPKELPPLPGIAAAEKAADVVPVKAETPADPNAPPLPPPTFVPPME